ncbi:MAG: galactose mutarotase [Verrucomicrobia subdivision 3 bacterium]|nr:galactose mutarotase [Verrucomicrobiota bacterium]MCC6820604.1 galactose mutarotase [Limisphaerales bacterium]
MQIKIQPTLAALTGLGGLCLIGCATMAESKMTISHAPFGQAPDGTPVQLYTLRNSRGSEAQICTYGGIVTSLKVADKHGKFGDVVLGYDTLDGYIEKSPHFGCLVGRYGNRIAKGKFTLNGKEYTLAVNNPPNSLHGGVMGFDKVVWKAKVLVSSTGPALELNYTSKDGEEGFPGNLKVAATYTLTEDNALRLDFIATTDADTVCNLTHHSYFNFAGKGEVLGHVVTIHADRFTPVDANMIPTGELRPVKGTPLDFTKPTSIGARINSDDEQIKLGGGYDHNWVVNQATPGQLTHAATVTEPTSGRVMEVWTTEPGIQFYTGNFLDGSITGKGGWTYQARNGFCFEPQHFPDSPNQPSFPTTVLKPGQTYQNTIIYKFSVR